MSVTNGTIEIIKNMAIVIGNITENFSLKALIGLSDVISYN